MRGGIFIAENETQRRIYHTMPFTFSHPAAALPLHSALKKWTLLPALVIGTLIPDAEYYCPMPGHFKQSAHSLVGTFSSSLPVGILVLLIFYWLRSEAVFVMPDPHRQPLKSAIRAPAGGVRGTVIALGSVLLGAWIHVLWDSVTHEWGWFVERTPSLQNPLFGNVLPGYQALQHFSTVFGLTVIVYAYHKWMKASGLPLWEWTRPSWRFYLWVVLLLTCAMAALIESDAIHMISTLYFRRSRRFVLVFLTSFISNFLVALCALCIAVKVLSRANRRKPIVSRTS
jgi:hypothetical protein